MAADVDGPGTVPGGRRPGRWTAAAAALLLVGGSAAVAFGVLDQDADPPAPPDARPISAATTPASPTPATTSPADGPTTAPSTGSPSPAASDPVETVAPQALPVQLRIPAIDVASDLVTVGLRPDGTLEVPSGENYDRAAWFDGSPRPGAAGPAVIEGHVDSAENGPSVFYRLGDLRAGDTVEVARADGTTVTFRVDDVRSYPKDEFPTLEVYGNTDGPQLRLITCGGDFDSASGHYVDNTVVFASLVEPA